MDRNIWLSKTSVTRILTLDMTGDQLTYTVFTDGGSRGNPGPAAFGYVIYDPQGGVVAQQGAYIGETTNNQAEYQGIVAALECLQTLNLDRPVTCKLDSELVVRQILGIYRMKHDGLRPWLEKVHTLVGQLPVSVTFTHIPRQQNQVADRLVNQALDEKAKDSHGTNSISSSNP